MQSFALRWLNLAIVALCVSAAFVLTGQGETNLYRADMQSFLAEVDRSYPFFELKGIRTEWEAAKPGLLERADKCESDGDFLGMVTDAIRCLRDAHMGLTSTRAKLPPRSQFRYPGFSLMPGCEGSVVVMWASERYSSKLQPGNVVLKIDGMDARQFLDEKARAAWSCDIPYSASSPQRVRLFIYRIPFASLQTEEHTLSYVQSGKTNELNVVSDLPVLWWPHTYCLPAGLTRHRAGLLFGKLPSGVGYAHVPKVTIETEQGLAAASSSWAEVTGCVVDLRGNSGGGYDNRLLERIKALPRPVAVVIDEGCISAGETLARDLARYGEARLFGQRTAGSSSSKRQWTFPSGKATVTFSTRSRWRRDGKPIEYNGIEPDFALEPNPEQVMRGINSEIHAAEQWVIENKGRMQSAAKGRDLDAK